MKICSECDKINENVEGDYCVFCGGKLVEKNEKTTKEEKIYEEELKQEPIQKVDTNKKIKVRVIILISIIFIVCGIVVYFKVSENLVELEEEIEFLNKQIIMLKEERNKISSENLSLMQTNSLNSKKIDFLDKYIVFVLDGYGNYYYTYDQMQQVTQGKTYSFWAYNIEQARDLGYRAWQ